LNHLLAITFSIIFSLASTQVFATQHFTCFPPDLQSTDRVIISLKDHASGTLVLTSGLDDWGNQESSGVLELRYSHQEMLVQVWVAKNANAQFTLAIPKNFIGTNSDQVKIALNLKNESNNISQNLDCYSRIYDK
jgi:hypothetical protein